MEILKIYSLLLLCLLLNGCGAVPIDNRYADKTSGGLPSGNPTTASTAQKSFEFGELATKPSFMKQDSSATVTNKAWYQFPQSESAAKYESVPGYRIQLLSTDNYSEALKMQDSVKALLGTHQTYIRFEPPYYKVKIGDLTEPGYAYELQYKLRQIGFKNPIVIQDSVLQKQK
jgi:hypothetical protein